MLRKKVLIKLYKNSEKRECHLTEGTVGKSPLQWWHFNGQREARGREEEEVGRHDLGGGLETEGTQVWPV